MRLVAPKWTKMLKSVDEVVEEIVRCTPFKFMVYIDEARNKMIIKCPPDYMGLISARCIGFCSDLLDNIGVENLIDKINSRNHNGKYEIAYMEYIREGVSAYSVYVVVRTLGRDIYVL